MFGFDRYKTAVFPIVWVLSLWLVLLPGQVSSSDQLSNDDFNRVMASVLSDSLSAQMTALRHFIRDHPDFEPAYQLLLERHIYGGAISEAQTLFQELSTSPAAHRNSTWMLARIHSLKGDVHAAWRFYRQALRDKISYPLIEDALDFLLQHPEQLDDSILFQDAPRGKVHQLILSAFSAHKEGNYPKSIGIFSKLSHDSLDHPLLFHIYGDCHYQLSNHAQADSIWKMGLQLSRKMKDLRYQAILLNRLGESARHSGRPQFAIGYFDSAYAAANRIGDFHLIQEIAGDYATALRFEGRFSEAAPLHKRAIEIADRLGLHRQTAGYYFSYAQTLYNTGSFTEALAAYDSAQTKILISTGNDRLLIQIEYCKGDIYKNMNQFALARNVYENSYQLAKTANLPDLQNIARRKLADLMLMVGQNDEAIRIYKEFLESTSNLQRQCYANRQIGEAYITKEQYDQARIFYTRALDIAHQANYSLYIGWCQAGVAKLSLLSGNIDDAIRNYETALDIATEIARTYNHYGLLVEVMKGLGDTYKASGDLERAIAAYRDAVSRIEESREKLRAEQLQIGYFSTVAEIYRKLINCYYHRFLDSSSPADLDSMFYFTEMARARGLKDLKFQKEPASDQLANDAVYAEYQELCNQLRLQQRYLREAAIHSSLSERERDSLYTALDMTRYLLISKRLRLVEESHSAMAHQVPSLQTVLKELRQEELGLLLYHIDREISFVLAAADEKAKIVPLSTNSEELKSLVANLVSPFHHLAAENMHDTPFRADIAYGLYQALVKPAEDSLALPQQLIIVPDNALLSLPFEMLLMEAPDKSVYKLTDEPTYAPHFLQNRYSVIYSPTTYLIEEESRDRSSDPGILVFANPFEKMPMLAQKRTTRQWDMRKGWRFDPLPFTEKEAKRISDVFSSAKVVKRSQATKAVFLEEAPKYKIIHIATHGFVDTTFDAFSGLVLAPGDESTDDGLIMGYEITDKKLNCDLIALSACETGLGKRVAGEGILGLPRLFLGAGAKSVLMTLWKVDDKFTSELMPEFYRLYLDEKLSKVEALAAAKRMVLGRERTTVNGMYYQHPFFWASFTLFGSPTNSFDLESGSKHRTYLIVTLLLVGIAALVFFSIRLYRGGQPFKGKPPA